MDIAAGEYGYDLGYFRRMLEAGAVDVLQADATRCAGITGFLRAAALAEAHQPAALGPLRALAARHAVLRRCPLLATSNISTITRASSTCSSTAR